MEINRKKCNDCENILYSKYYNSSISSDITLISNDNPIGILCHKLILREYSDYFIKLFESPLSERFKHEIVLQNFPYYWLEKFIKFIYCGVLQFDHCKFKEVLEYGSFLLIDGFSELCDKEACCHIIPLLEIYGHNVMLELSSWYTLSECRKHIYVDILEKYDTPVLLSLSIDVFNEILPILPVPIDYTQELKDKCNDIQIPNMTIEGGKCFGNIPIIYTLNSIDKGLYVIKERFIQRLDDKNRLAKTCVKKIIVSTIIRHNIKTISVNYNGCDTLLNNAIQHIIDKLACTKLQDKYEIYSPNENICVITWFARYKYRYLCRVFRDDLSYTDVSYENIFACCDACNFNNVGIAVSSLNIYFIACRRDYLNKERIIHNISYAILPINNCTVIDKNRV